jgi:hypothetical protein
MAMPVNHPLHVKVADLVEKALPKSCKLIRDKACGGSQRIPLFISKQKSRGTELCNVDLLVLRDNNVRLIVEIEESDVKPTQVCGKFLCSALSRYDIHEAEGNAQIEMGANVAFIQVVETSGLKMDRTSKLVEWQKLEDSIREVLPARGSAVTEYRVFQDDQLEELVRLARAYLFEDQ